MCMMIFDSHPIICSVFLVFSLCTDAVFSRDSYRSLATLKFQRKNLPTCRESKKSFGVRNRLVCCVALPRHCSKRIIFFPLKSPQLSASVAARNVPHLFRHSAHIIFLKFSGNSFQKMEHPLMNYPRPMKKSKERLSIRISGRSRKICEVWIEGVVPDMV